MSHIKSAVLTISTFVALASPAFAAGPPRPIPPACHVEVARLCPGTAPGDHRFNRCMNQHKAEISKECRAALKASRVKRPGKPAA